MSYTYMCKTCVRHVYVLHMSYTYMCKTYIDTHLSHLHHWIGINCFSSPQIAMPVPIYRPRMDCQLQSIVYNLLRVSTWSNRKSRAGIELWSSSPRPLLKVNKPTTTTLCTSDQCPLHQWPLISSLTTGPPRPLLKHKEWQRDWWILTKKIVRRFYKNVDDK